MAGAVSGRKFRDIREFKKLLLSNDRLIAANLARQQTVYATVATGQPAAWAERRRASGALANPCAIRNFPQFFETPRLEITSRIDIACIVEP
jgi:hypothetical protein